MEKDEKSLQSLFLWQQKGTIPINFWQLKLTDFYPDYIFTAKVRLKVSAYTLMPCVLNERIKKVKMFLHSVSMATKVATYQQNWKVTLIYGIK